MAAKQAAF